MAFVGVRLLSGRVLLSLSLIGAAVTGTSCSDNQTIPSEAASSLSPQSPATRPAAAWRSVKASEFAQHLGGNAVVLDVRTAGEFQAGHLPHAINIDVNSPDFARRVAELDKGRTYLVYCASGRRSARASTQMAQMGFKRLYNLDGGINSWQQQGGPLETPAPRPARSGG